MKNILFLSLSPLDNDNRILKEINSLTKANYNITMVSINTKNKYDFKSVSLNFKSKTLFGIPGLNRLLLTYEYLKIIPKEKHFDVVHCHDLDAFVLGCMYQKIYNRNVKIVYDAHEYETETNGLSGLKKILVKYSEKLFIKYADKIICVSNTIANEYVRLYSIEKPTLVLNTPPYKEITKKNIFRETFSIGKEKTIFLYQGALSTGRGIEILLDTFKSIDNDNIVMIFMGYGQLKGLIENAADKYSNIYFHLAVSPDVLLDYTCSADIGIHMAQDNCLSYRYALPNKILEYIMAELPLLVTDLPEMATIVKKYNIGIIIKGNTSNDLKEAIKSILNKNLTKIKENTKQAKLIYNWEQQEINLLHIYKELNL